MMFSRFRLRYTLPVIGLIVAAAVVVTAFAMDEDVLGKEQVDRLTGDGDVTLSETTISPDEAREAAQTVATGQFDGVEVERHGDRVVYEVEIGDSEVLVDAADGSIVNVEVEEDDDDRDDVDESLETPALTIDDAVRIAEGATSGAVGDTELDLERGRLVYEVEVGSDEVTIDANDGSVLSVQADD